MALPIIAGGLRALAGRLGGGLARSMGGFARAAVSREAGLRRVETRIRWFGKKVEKNVNVGVDARVKLAAQLVRDRTVRNISQPVKKIKVGRARDEKGKFLKQRTRVVPASRSRPGGFPRADTTRLMKDIYWEHQGNMRAIVGTTLDYGLWLEISMDRSFLKRTLNEMHGEVARIIGRGGPRLPGQE